MAAMFVYGDSPELDLPFTDGVDPLTTHVQGQALVVGQGQARVARSTEFREYATDLVPNLTPASLDTLVLIELPELSSGNAAALTLGLRSAMAPLKADGRLIVVSYDEQARARLQRLERAAGYLGLTSHHLDLNGRGGALILTR